MNRICFLFVFQEDDKTHQDGGGGEDSDTGQVPGGDESIFLYFSSKIDFYVSIIFYVICHLELLTKCQFWPHKIFFGRAVPISSLPINEPWHTLTLSTTEIWLVICSGIFPKKTINFKILLKMCWNSILSRVLGSFILLVQMLHSCTTSGYATVLSRWKYIKFIRTN